MCRSQTLLSLPGRSGQMHGGRLLLKRSDTCCMAGGRTPSAGCRRPTARRIRCNVCRIRRGYDGYEVLPQIQGPARSLKAPDPAVAAPLSRMLLIPFRIEAEERARAFSLQRYLAKARRHRKLDDGTTGRS